MYAEATPRRESVLLKSRVPHSTVCLFVGVGVIDRAAPRRVRSVCRRTFLGASCSLEPRLGWHQVDPVNKGDTRPYSETVRTSLPPSPCRLGHPSLVAVSWYNRHATASLGALRRSSQESVLREHQRALVIVDSPQYNPIPNLSTPFLVLKRSPEFGRDLSLRALSS